MAISPELERTGYRAPLALRCFDPVTGRTVGDGLSAVAGLEDDTAPARAAKTSPVSGLLGFGSLPGQRAYQRTRSTGGQPLQWPATGAAVPFVVRVTDHGRRYLPTTLRAQVPVSAPIDVPLFSAANRPAPSGWAAVRGEARVGPGGPPAAWSVVEVSDGVTDYRALGDDSGRFLLYLPYPEALPPLLDTPQAAPGALSWPLTIGIRYEPDQLRAPADASTSDPPFLDSILAQANAGIEVGGSPQPTITATLAFGITLVLPIAVVPA